MICEIFDIFQLETSVMRMFQLCEDILIGPHDLNVLFEG